MAVKTRGLLKTYVEPFGWLNSLYLVAEKGVFNKPDENPIESVKNTNLYKVLTYLSWVSAKNEYESRVSEKIANPNRIDA